jgi:anti-sigma regulatory factor (Ser/Thr protein kinase)
VSVNIRLSAPAQWHAGAIAARDTWPPLVMLQLAAPLEDTDDDDDGSVLVRALASDAAPAATAVPAPRPGAARATIVGAAPMSATSFTAWAQRALLGTANPLIGDVLAWALPQGVTELDLPGDARASHHARTAMRSICDGLSCVDDVLLATSELTANALQHGTGAPRLTAIRGERSVTVALTDRRPDAVPVVQRLRGSAASSGRGMAIVDAISSHWGVTVYHDHKVVWCELPADDTEGAGPSAR